MVIQNLIRTIPGWLTSVEISGDSEISIKIKPEFTLEFFQFIRDYSNTQTKILVDLTATDFSTHFEIVTHVLSVNQQKHIRVKTPLTSDFVQSLSKLYPAAGWFEREVYDLFGILFINHKDLRAILTDYGFEGHPFRKDYPLSGFSEVQYNNTKKRVINKDLEFSQEFRSFDFVSPWE